MVVVLDAGYFLIGDKNRYAWDQGTLEEIANPKIHGFPDYSGHCLQQFYSYLFPLLRNADTGLPNTDDYLRMPIAVGEHSVNFALGALAEVGKCAVHGSYLKKFTVEKIDQILSATDDTRPINWIKVLDLAKGESGTDIERYEKQPGDITVYDPDGLGFENLLMGDQGNLTFESIVIDGQQYWLPWYYVGTHKLIEPCPKC